ncbi:MAG: hypothetical protein WDN06_16530 [Asticcacaulis sp.]
MSYAATRRKADANAESFADRLGVAIFDMAQFAVHLAARRLGGAPAGGQAQALDLS